MLGHLGSGCGCYERCAGGDVEGERAAAACAAGIYQLFTLSIGERNGNGVGAHFFDKSGQLRGKLAARGKNGEECGGFDIRNRAGEDFTEDFSRLLARERCAVFGKRL